MKTPPIFCLLAGMMALTLVSCGEKPAETPAPTPAPTEVSTPEPTPVPFLVQKDDVPPGEYAPWQEGYAEFLRDLRQREGELKNWVDTAPSDEVNEDLERWGAYNVTSEEYSLCDVDKDGVPELFIKYGICEADYHSVCYTFRDGQVAEVGDFPSGHSSLYSWPGENGVILYQGHQGLADMERYAITDGKLVSRGIFFDEEIWGTDKEYTPVEEVVPGAEYMQSHFMPTHWRPGDSPALTLPVYDYGIPVRQGSPCLERAEVLAAVGKVLWEGEPFFGVSGDGFHGDTGWTTLSEYLEPGVAYAYNDEPLTPIEYAFADMNGDGQEDCILRLEGGYYVVFHVQNGTVYAYFFSYMEEPMVLPDGSVYFSSSSKYGDIVRFYGNQCYTLLYQPPVEGDGLAWDDFTPPPPEPEFSMPEEDYAPWQTAYMEFITELCEKEKPLRQWVQEAAKEELEAGPERAGAVNNCSDSYFLYDVDKDNVPELFIQYGTIYVPWIRCYTYRNGEVVQIGEISGGAKGANFFTWPGKNAILNYWAWKGAFILWEYSIVDGELVCVDEDGIASQFGGPGEPDPRDYIPHTLPLEFHRIRAAKPEEDTPMLLLICNYGGQTPLPAAKEERRAAKEAIEEVLYRAGLFYGLPGGSGYEGTTGWITLEEYCQEGAANSYNTVTPSQLVWLDLNGDGVEECVVRFLELDERAGYSHMTVFSWQEDVVYGYAVSYFDGNDLSADGKFYMTDPLWVMDEIGVKNFVFHRNQCYFEIVPRPEKLVPAPWKPFSS